MAGDGLFIHCPWYLFWQKYPSSPGVMCLKPPPLRLLLCEALSDCSPCSLPPLQPELGRPPQHSTVSKTCLYICTFLLFGLVFMRAFLLATREVFKGKRLSNHLFYLYQHNYIENAKKKENACWSERWTNSGKIPHLSHTVKKWYKYTFP